MVIESNNIVLSHVIFLFKKMQTNADNTDKQEQLQKFWSAYISLFFSPLSNIIPNTKDTLQDFYKIVDDVHQSGKDDWWKLLGVYS